MSKRSITAKYLTDFNDDQFITAVLDHIKMRLNVAPDTKLWYQYERLDYWIKLNVRVNGRMLRINNLDVTKSDIEAEIDRYLRILWNSL